MKKEDLFSFCINNSFKEVFMNYFKYSQEVRPTKVDHVSEEVSFEQFCIDWDRAFAELYDEEEEPMGTGRYMHNLLPAEKRREQTRKAKERRLKRFRPAIYDGDGKLLVDKGFCRKKYDKAKAEIAKAMKAFTKKYGRFGRINSDSYYDFVREMKKDFPKLIKYLEIVRKHEKDVKFAEHYGAYDEDGALIRPADSKAKELTPEEEAEKDPRHDTSVPAPVNTEPHIKSAKKHSLSAKERIALEKKKLKCGSFNAFTKAQKKVSFRLMPPSLPSDPGKRPYPYF